MLTENGPVNVKIIAIKPRSERQLKPLLLLCALKMHLKIARAERTGNVCSDGFETELISAVCP